MNIALIDWCQTRPIDTYFVRLFEDNKNLFLYVVNNKITLTP